MSVEWMEFVQVQNQEEWADDLIENVNSESLLMSELEELWYEDPKDENNDIQNLLKNFNDSVDWIGELNWVNVSWNVLDKSILKKNEEVNLLIRNHIKEWKDWTDVLSDKLKEILSINTLQVPNFFERTMINLNSRYFPDVKVLWDTEKTNQQIAQAWG